MPRGSPGETRIHWPGLKNPPPRASYQSAEYVQLRTLTAGPEFATAEDGTYHRGFAEYLLIKPEKPGPQSDP